MLEVAVVVHKELVFSLFVFIFINHYIFSKAKEREIMLVGFSDNFE